MSALLERPAPQGRRFQRSAPAEGGDQLTPLERLEALCDPGSLQLIRTEVLSTTMGDRARHGDGVLGGSGTVGGRPVFCYAQDPQYAGGSLGEPHADTIARVLELADRGRAPVVGFVSSGGARMQEGIGALGGYGRIFKRTVALSGKVPQISIVTGLSAGGGAYSPALTDFIVMTQESSMFLTGPGVVQEALGEVVDAETLGGAKVHAKNGVSHFVARDDSDAAALARELLAYLPSNSSEAAPHVRRRPPSGANPGAIVPVQQRRVYDVRDVIGAIVDGGELLEVSAGWARNLVTGFARLDGRTVGVVANQPRYTGGVLDVASSEKGARFVAKCDAFGIPLLVLVDTPGYMPGVRQESAGVIRAGAEFVHAFAQATVPRITVILRKAFGGAFITMNSKDLGADYVFAWPESEIGIMGAKPAVGVIHRRRLAAAEDPEAEREQLAADYAETQLRPEVAAARGFVDELIAPQDTRARLVWAYNTLAPLR
jgi:acetyl-CoA carboxylase carboxyltransferase component